MKLREKSRELAKTVVTMALSIAFVMSCSSFSKPSTRNWPEKTYIPCDEGELKDVPPGEEIGLFCAVTCKKRKFLSKRCKVWDYDVVDMKSPKDFRKFRAANFRLVGAHRFEQL